MAQIDSRIPLMVQAPQIEPYQNVLARGLRNRQLQAATALQDQKISDSNALRDVARRGELFGADGMLAPNALQQIAQFAPGSLPQFAELSSKQTDLAQQREVRNVDLATKRQKWAMNAIQMADTPERALSLIQEAASQGIISPQDAQNWSQQIPGDPTAYAPWRDRVARSLGATGTSYYTPLQGAGGFQAFNNRTGQVAPIVDAAGNPVLPVSADVNLARDRAQATKEGSGAGEITVGKQKKAVDAGNTLELLSRAEGLIKDSTGSALGTAVDALAGGVGISMDGAEAIAALNTLAGQLISKMPRMEGPQSDKDVQLYRQMAGDLANPMIPRETRLAALKEIRALNEKYAGGQSEKVVKRRGRTKDGRTVVEYTDGTREVLQ